MRESIRLVAAGPIGHSEGHAFLCDERPLWLAADYG